MSTMRIDKIGLVAACSPKGDWAFNLAFYFARLYSLQFNIFSFTDPPFAVSAFMNTYDTETDLDCTDKKQQIIAERKLREYYDEMLGDYDNVGFKVCNSHKHNLEMRRCLKEKEYHLLIIPYLYYGLSFANMPIEEFAFRFIAPVILVGPDHPHKYSINKQAELAIDALSIPVDQYQRIKTPDRFQPSPVL